MIRVGGEGGRRGGVGEGDFSRWCDDAHDKNYVRRSRRKVVKPTGGRTKGPKKLFRKFDWVYQGRQSTVQGFSKWTGRKNSGI